MSRRINTVRPRRNRVEPIVTTVAEQGDIPRDAHRNFMGGPSYDIPELLRLRCVAASCFFGEPQYYRADKENGVTTSNGPTGRRNSRLRALPGSSRPYIEDAIFQHLDTVLGALAGSREWVGMSPKHVVERCIDDALNVNPEATLQIASILRNEDHIRTTPQVIAVRAANHPSIKGTGLLRRYQPLIMKRMDEPAIQLAYQLSTYGRSGIPNSLKRSWAERYRSASEYELAKYRSENRAVKSVDVVRMIDFPWTTQVAKLMNGELSQSGSTWESIRSDGGSWEDCVEFMGHMALLRNIRNFLKNDVSIDVWLDKLVDTAENGKQLPFRYWVAYKEIFNNGLRCSSNEDVKIKEALEKCIFLSMKNLKDIPGKSLVLSDNSGSAWGCAPGAYNSCLVAEIGNMMGIITTLASDEGVFGIFGDRVEYLEVKRNISIFDQLKNSCEFEHHIGTGTEHGIWLAMDEIIRNVTHFDNIFIYSDMQAGHGGLYGTNSVPDRFLWSRSVNPYGYTYLGRSYIDVPMLISLYREKVNPDVNVFCVQIAGYEDTIIPEYYDRTYIMGGWSDGILSFASRMIEMNK